MKGCSPSTPLHLLFCFIRVPMTSQRDKHQPWPCGGDGELIRAVCSVTPGDGSNGSLHSDAQPRKRLSGLEVDCSTSEKTRKTITLADTLVVGGAGVVCFKGFRQPARRTCCNSRWRKPWCQESRSWGHGVGGEGGRDGHISDGSYGTW